jgi:hypothetical protein
VSRLVARLQRLILEVLMTLVVAVLERRMRGAVNHRP